MWNKFYITLLFLSYIYFTLIKDKIILGIDPGTNIMGYSLIENKGSAIKLIIMDVINLTALTNQPLKLKKIFETTLAIIDEYHPDELAIEAPFYGKNPQSMLKLGRAQGVAIAAALYRSLTVFEYAPRKIKQSITGNGNASKEQVAAMLSKMLLFKDIPKYLDASDALAVAVCHFNQRNTASSDSETSYSGWGSFIKNNPGRLK
jgi:crossover junction endodeoxyribonuclease RuvC